MGERRGSLSPSESSHSEQVEDASLRAAISLFSNTYNVSLELRQTHVSLLKGLLKDRNGKQTSAASKVGPKNVRFTAADLKKKDLSAGASASEQKGPDANKLDSTIGKLIEKLTRNAPLVLNEVQAVTSFLQSAHMTLP